MSRETRKEVIAIIQGRDAGGLTPGVILVDVLTWG